jgi:hypothetical protein
MTKKIASFIALFLALDTMPALAAGPYVDLNAELKKTTAMNPVTEKILKDAVAGYDPSKPQKSVAEINKETKDSIKQEQKAQKQAEREEKKAEREDKRNERKEQRAEKKAERAEAKQSEETKIETKEIKELQSEYEDAKATEQSKANRTLTAASTAATGIGGMELAQGLSEQNADKAAEADMNAYISTFRCKYAGGTSVKASMEEIELPGGNDANMMKYRAEYFALAADLKERKNALGLTPGIESIEVLDKSQMGLYDDEFTGITAGNYASLYRAKMLGSETDQALIDEAKKTSKNRVIGGAVAAGAGIIGGVVGDMLINGNKDKNKNKNSATDNNDDDEYNEYLDEDGEPSGEDGGNYNQTAVFSDVSEITNKEDCDSVLGYWDDDMKCQCIDATYFNADTQSCESEEFDMGDITIAPDTTEIVATAKPTTSSVPSTTETTDAFEPEETVVLPDMTFDEELEEEEASPLPKAVKQYNCEKSNGEWSNDVCTCREPDLMPDADGRCIISKNVVKNNQTDNTSDDWEPELIEEEASDAPAAPTTNDKTREKNCKDTGGIPSGYGTCICPYGQKEEALTGNCVKDVSKDCDILGKKECESEYKICEINGQTKECTGDMLPNYATSGHCVKSPRGDHKICTATACDTAKGYELAKNSKDESQGHCTKKVVQERNNQTTTTKTTTKTDHCESLRKSGQFKTVTTMTEGRCSVECKYGFYLDTVHKKCESMYNTPGDTQKSPKGIITPSASSSNTTPSRPNNSSKAKKDIYDSNTFYNTQVNATQAKQLIALWAKRKNITVTCPEKPANNTTFICESSTTKYHFTFEDLSESFKSTQNKSIAIAVCKLMGGKKQTDSDTGLDSKIHCEIDKKTCENELNAALKPFNQRSYMYSVYIKNGATGSQTLDRIYCTVDY